MVMRGLGRKYLNVVKEACREGACTERMLLGTVVKGKSVVTKSESKSQRST